MARKPSSSNLSRRVLITVQRDMAEVTSKVAWQHELPILHVLHGEDKVKLVDPATMDDGYAEKVRPELLPYNKTMDIPARPSTAAGLGFAFIGDPAVEWQRLADVYGRHPEEGVLLVEKVYGRPQDGTLGDLIGSPTLKDLPEGQLRSMILAQGYASEAHHDAPHEEKQAVWALRAELNAMPHADLVALAEKVGVDIG